MNRKVILVTIRINGQEQICTSENEYNQLQSTGLRVLCNIINGNGAVSPTANIKLYGLALNTMLKLMRIQWNTLSAVLNTVLIEAGEEGGTLVKVYEGNITFAKINMANAPDVYLDIESQSAIVDALMPAQSKIFEANTDAAAMIEEICTDMKYIFQNNGASKVIADGGTYNGTRLNMIKKIAEIADFDLYIEQNTIAICPKGGPRKLPVPIISPKSGLIGYPVPDVRGISFKAFYDPLIRFGGLVEIRDSLLGDTVNGQWRIFGTTVTIEANLDGGAWFIDCNAAPLGGTNVAIAK